MIQRFLRHLVPAWALVGVCVALLVGAARANTEVKVRALPMTQKVAQGGQLVVAIELDHGAELHTWPARGVELPADVDELAIRTEIGPPKDAKDQVLLPSWIGAFDGVQYPPTKIGKAQNPSPGPDGNPASIDVPMYAGKVAAFARLKVKPDAPLGAQKVELLVSYQACNDQMCFQPEDIAVPVNITVVAAGSTDLGAASEPGLFKSYDASKWGSGGSMTPVKPLSPTPPEQPTPAQPLPVAAPPSGGSLFGINLGTSVWLLFLAAGVGGLVLNLTPCVLPVIPIKVLTLTKHASSKSHALSLGLWMFAGIVAFWAAIGIPMAFISASLDPSQLIFGTWWVTFAIGLIIVILALGIMGMFSINLPQSVYAVEAEADSAFGSFMFGVLTAVLGLPCFGFVAGSLFAAAAALPPVTIMSIFVGIGVGMGAPYLILSVYPKLLNFVPRTGPASELVKQVMGILLLAAAAFFITAGIQALLKSRPYLSGSMTWWAVGFFVALASIWMTIRTVQISKAVWPKVAIPALGLIMTLGIGIFAQERLNQDRRTYEDRKVAAAQGQTPAGVWLEYTPELFASVQASGRPVFLDFTADWCLTCKALKAALLDQEPLKSQFRLRGLVLMEVDTTVRNSQGSEKLKSLGRTGVPTWAVFAPGSEKPHFIPVERPTSGTVLAELDAVGVKAPTATAASGVPGSTATR